MAEASSVGGDQGTINHSFLHIFIINIAKTFFLFTKNCFWFCNLKMILVAALNGSDVKGFESLKIMWLDAVDSGDGVTLTLKVFKNKRIHKNIKTNFFMFSIILKYVLRWMRVWPKDVIGYAISQQAAAGASKFPSLITSYLYIIIL